MYRMQSFVVIALLLTDCYQISHSFTHGVDVYENIENCSGNLSGPDCDIPYVTCDDGKRKCFNNSTCRKNNNNNEYYCDCNSVVETTDSTRFAGLECEHSSTSACTSVEDGFGSQFCTNGGQCINTMHEGVIRGGCACPSEFIGAYCQYLASSITGGIAGESILPDVQENFWILLPEKNPEKKSGSRINSIAIGISVSFIAMITLGFIVTFMKRKKLIREQEKIISMDPTAIEADGSGTFEDRAEVL